MTSHASMLLIVAIGGAVGAMTRFQVTHWLSNGFGANFPIATLFVNVVGSFIIGALASALNQSLLVSLHWRPLVIVGFLGALTTFSTFSLDTFLFMTQGLWLKAILNILFNVLLCIAAVSGGYYLIERFS